MEVHRRSAEKSMRPGSLARRQQHTRLRLCKPSAVSTQVKKLLAFIRKVRALLRCTGVVFTGRIESQVIVSRQIVFTPVPSEIFVRRDRQNAEGNALQRRRCLLHAPVAFSEGARWLG